MEKLPKEDKGFLSTLPGVQHLFSNTCNVRVTQAYQIFNIWIQTLFEIETRIQTQMQTQIGIGIKIRIQMKVTIILKTKSKLKRCKIDSVWKESKAHKLSDWRCKLEISTLSTFWVLMWFSRPPLGLRKVVLSHAAFPNNALEVLCSTS